MAHWRVICSLVLACASIAVLSAAHRAAEQVVPAGTGLILGRVVDAETGQPVSGVLISLGGGGAPSPSPAGIAWRLLTDAQGRFVFRNLPQGAYSIVATVGGNGFSPSGFLVSGAGNQIGAYLNGGYGQLRPGGALETIELGEGDRIPDAVIRLWKGGAIEGTVRDEAGEPLIGMVVSAVRRTSDGRLINGPTTTTDDRGAYRLGTLLPGEYVVVVPQTNVMLPAATVDDLAAIPAGGAPSQNFGTAMLPRSMVFGGIPVGSSRVLTTSLRDVATLPPVATGGALHVYQTTFHPASTVATQATAIAIASGQERQGIDVNLQPARASSVVGTLMDGSGPVEQFAVYLMPVDAGGGESMLEVARTVTDGRGAFTFPLVAAGQYTVLATRRVPLLGARGAPPPVPRTVADQAGAWAMQTITVGARDISDLALVLRPPPQLSGRLEFQSVSGRAAPDLQRFGLLLARVPYLFRDLLGTPPATVQANGEFVISGQPPGRYEIRIPGVPPGWALQSITIAGRDVTDALITVEEKDISGIVILFTDQPAELTGTVRGADGAPDPTASVLLFPSDRTRWPDARRIRSFRNIRVAKNGAFSLSALIPGDYLVAAVSDAHTADWPDERLLTRLLGTASPVRIGSGQKQTVTLKTIELR
jgi:carboxypeptidase family protein